MAEDLTVAHLLSRRRDLRHVASAKPLTVSVYVTGGEEEFTTRISFHITTKFGIFTGFEN